MFSTLEADKVPRGDVTFRGVTANVLTLMPTRPRNPSRQIVPCPQATPVPNLRDSVTGLEAKTGRVEGRTKFSLPNNRPQQPDDPKVPCLRDACAWMTRSMRSRWNQPDVRTSSPCPFLSTRLTATSRRCRRNRRSISPSPAVRPEMRISST